MAELVDANAMSELISRLRSIDELLNKFNRKDSFGFESRLYLTISHKRIGKQEQFASGIYSGQFSSGYFIANMAKKKDETERVIPNVCYCKKCENGGKIEDFKVMCKVQNIWQHSPQNCKYYIEK